MYMEMVEKYVCSDVAHHHWVFVCLVGGCFVLFCSVFVFFIMAFGPNFKMCPTFFRQVTFIKFEKYFYLLCFTQVSSFYVFLS